MKPWLYAWLCLFYLVGCGSLLEQKWGPNLAQEATSLTPALIDGNLTTKASIPLRLTNLHKLSGYPPAETVIQLGSVQEIRRIVVHSHNLTNFQLWAYNETENCWQPIAFVKSHHPPTSSVRIRTKTDRIKLKVNTIAVLGARSVAEKILKNEPIQSGQSSKLAKGKLIERLKQLGQNLDQMKRLKLKLPTINEIEIYGVK